MEAREAVKSLRLLENFAKVLQPLREICELASTLDDDIAKKQNQLENLKHQHDVAITEHANQIQALRGEIEDWRSRLSDQKMKSVAGINLAAEELEAKRSLVNKDIETLDNELKEAYKYTQQKKNEFAAEIREKQAEYDDLVTKVRTLQEAIGVIPVVNSPFINNVELPFQNTAEVKLDGNSN